MGSGLLAGDEEKGTLDLVLSHPISRTRLFAGRSVRYLTAILIILFVLWLSFIISGQGTQLERISAGVRNGATAAVIGRIADIFRRNGAAFEPALTFPTRRDHGCQPVPVHQFLPDSGMASIDSDLEPLEILFAFSLLPGR
jgi:ABC-type Na+ efflux pump permease subunit